MSTKKELRFDQVLLDSMEEPLSVRVEKIKGGNRMPIDLPPREADMPSGVGWDKTSVRRLETWLVNDWSGGGLYHITVSDATGRKMEWQALYDPRQFPEMIPHTMQANINQPAIPRPAAQAAPPPQIAAAPPSNGGLYSMWPPPGYLFAQSGPIAGSPPAQAPQPQPMSTQPTPIPLPWTWAQPPTIMQQPTAPAPVQAQPPSVRGSMLDDIPRRRFRFDEDGEEKRQLENRTRELEEKVRQGEKERIEADYKTQLERARLDAERQVKDMQQAQAAQAEALKEELRRMREAHQQPVGVNPEMEAIKEERARIERERENMLREQREVKDRDERNRENMLREQRDAKERDEVNKRFEQLQTLIAKIAEQPKSVGPDPALIAMQDELRRERERSENERREREKEERARLERETLREEIRRREEDSKRREDMLVLQINEIKANATKGPDPILQIMENNTRNQIDALKEMMRAQQMSNDRMQNLTMSPRDMISLLKENSSGIDELKRGVVDVYKDVFEMQRMIVEQAAQLNNTGESPTMRLVETGLARAGELADRYFKTKRDEVVSAAKVQEATIAAQAQNAQAYAIQQARLAQLAQQEAVMRNQAAAQAAQATAQAAQAIKSGLDGTAVAELAKQGALSSAKEASTTTIPAATTTSTKKKKAATAQTTIDDGTTDPVTGKTIAKIIPLRRLGRTDEEWFGQAFDHVKSLRTAVDEFIKSLKATPARVDPKTGKIVGASPEQCIEFLIRAVNYILAQNLEVAAVKDLFMEDRFAELLDIVIPDAPQGYRDDCVKILYLMAEEAAKEQAGPQVADVGEEDEDDDDDDDDEDDDKDGEFNDQNREE